MFEYVVEYKETHDERRRRRILNLMASFAIVYLSVVDFMPMTEAQRRFMVLQQMMQAQQQQAQPQQQQQGAPAPAQKAQ